jgi:hypothetical protein
MGRTRTSPHDQEPPCASRCWPISMATSRALRGCWPRSPSWASTGWCQRRHRRRTAGWRDARPAGRTRRPRHLDPRQRRVGPGRRLRHAADPTANEHDLEVGRLLSRPHRDRLAGLPWQARVQVPPAGRPTRRPVGGGVVGGQHLRLAAAGAGGRRRAIDQGPAGPPWSARRRPAKLDLDKGYDYPRCRRVLRRRGITPRIAWRGIEQAIGWAAIGTWWSGRWRGWWATGACSSATSGTPRCCPGFCIWRAR